mmetsp:Transcript_6313/g.14537  ORF Transcript_6313/g.14537 Transcript_6313/m.14537 type:complete len:248 (-) Transcript_6313:767-1510(-)
MVGGVGQAVLQAHGCIHGCVHGVCRRRRPRIEPCAAWVALVRGQTGLSQLLPPKLLRHGQVLKRGRADPRRLLGAKAVDKPDSFQGPHFHRLGVQGVVQARAIRRLPLGCPSLGMYRGGLALSLALSLALGPALGLVDWSLVDWHLGWPRGLGLRLRGPLRARAISARDLQVVRHLVGLAFEVPEPGPIHLLLTTNRARGLPCGLPRRGPLFACCPRSLRSPVLGPLHSQLLDELLDSVLLPHKLLG